MHRGLGTHPRSHADSPASWHPERTCVCSEADDLVHPGCLSPHADRCLMSNSATASNANGVANEQVKTFTPLVQQFLDWLKLERHFSGYTVKSYGADLAQFCLFLAGEIGQQTPEPP